MIIFDIIFNKKNLIFCVAEFPWVVAIILRVHEEDSVVNVYKCAGSLIHPSVVMTVGHCVYDLKKLTDIKIRAGEWDTQTSNEPFPHQDREIVDIVVHENYRKGSHFNDIALLFLDTPVELAENVNTVCLPPQDFKFDNKRCSATGWGMVIIDFIYLIKHFKSILFNSG